ncbi:MAG: serine--tRNA ligase [Candidatus Heimdallarchaeota archaeon]|nr:serine--tRNA ligase [Candidatus Heimdallarchaeota archaeon]
MLDPKLLREDPDAVKENLKRRKDPALLNLVDEFLELDETWRQLDKVINGLRKQRNIYAKDIAKAKGADKNKLITEMKSINTDLGKNEEVLKKTDEKRQFILDRLPNLLHESVPFGEDDEDNVVMRKKGRKKSFKFPIKDHHQLMEELDLVELERARKTSGSRFYFLKNEAVILELALIRYAIDVLKKHGVDVLSTPSMVRKEMLYGSGFLPMGDEDIYKIQGEDLALIGTSEVTLAGYHYDEILLEDELPIRYAGLSSCFRTEASASTKDDKGIFRVHEFKKVEMFTYTLPENSPEEQERMIGIAEEIFQGLKLPYQVVNICTGDLGGVASRKFDIEVFLPGQDRYREVVSCSNCTDYQSRRLKIRYREKEGAPVKGLVHTLNSTAITTTRPIIAILENYQREDGSIKIPDVLIPYTGFDTISPKQ